MRPGFGISGAIRSHSSSVKSQGWRFVLRAILAIRPRVFAVHIQTANHIRNQRE